MKGCDRIKDLFGAYLQNDVTSLERAAVEEHIDGCEECANDLQSRQKVLEKLKPAPLPDEESQTSQADFASDVYRRIAQDTMRQRSRQAFRRRFVLQPAFAALALAAILTVGVTQLRPGDHTAQNLAAVTEVDGTDQKELRAELHKREFFRRQGIVRENEPGYVSASKVSDAKSPSSDMNYFMRDTLVSVSRRWLAEANFIYYSLGDRGRALAKYQQLIDYYPTSEAAVEARERIKDIQGIESGSQTENADAEMFVDTGI